MVEIENHLNLMRDFNSTFDRLSNSRYSLMISLATLIILSSHVSVNDMNDNNNNDDKRKKRPHTIIMIQQMKYNTIYLSSTPLDMHVHQFVKCI